MSIQLVGFGFGCLLLLVAILGGGFQIKEITVPRVGKASRLAACLFGLLFVGLAARPDLLSLGAERAIPTAQPAAVPATPAVVPASSPPPAPPQQASAAPVQGQPAPQPAAKKPHWEELPRDWLNRLRGR